METHSSVEGPGVPEGAVEAVGAVLVAGAGITGIQASLDLAQSGFRVYLAEPTLAIGGRMAQLDKTFPTGDCSMCILSPKLVEAARNKNISILTLADIERVTGSPGNFEVTLRRRPRYVDEKKCNACGECAEVCPVSLPSEFDRGLGLRKAIFRPYPQAIPNTYGISKADASAPCRAACPAGVNAQGYLALVAKGRFQDAYELVRERCSLPAVCGRICQHPCEGQCNRKELDQPVAVRDIKRFAADWVHAHRDELRPTQSRPVQLRDERVAVVGGGPAGLTAAHDLARLGYRVTLLEARDFLGGMLRVGVPAYRLPRDVLDREIEELLGNRIEVRLGVKLGSDFTLESLQAHHQAVFLATGAHQSVHMQLEGSEAKGVMYGLDFLARVNLGKKVRVGDTVAVVGGGNVAMDAARAALRLGASHVTVVYRRGRAEMPALPEELEQAEEEGVRLELLTNPVRVLSGPDRRVSGLECLRMKLGRPDASGRRRPVPLEDSNFELSADTVIIAVGQRADLEGFPLVDGKIKTNPFLATDTPGVFAGGDVVLGPASLVEAMAHGHQAAAAIHAYLRQEPLPAAERTRLPLAPNPTPGAPARPRHPMRRSDEQRRVGDFREIELGYTPEEAMAEAGRCLACGLCSECGLCVKTCSAGAIVHDMQPREQTLKVGSIILTPGYDALEAATRPEFGHGRYPNVLSSAEFERMLSASGPTEGKVVRPSDGKPVRKIAFLQCVGSRDAARGNDYCSAICCMSAAKEAMVAIEHVSGLEVSIFCMDVRAFGKEFDQYVERAKREHGVRFVHAMPSRLIELPESRSLRVRYFQPGGGEVLEDFDLVVLSVGLKPSPWVKQTALKIGLRLNQFGFCDTDRLAPLAASAPGVFVAGAFQEPKDIPESVAQASAAAACAMAELAPVRGTQLERHEYPWERDVTDEPPRVGVFICHCGHNIGSVVDVARVASAARKLPGVVHSETNLYACSDTSQEHIKQVVRDQRLNRLVVASCSPRTHEVLFQETLRESGLNQYLFAMTNIRDQCSWVHRNQPEAATDKAVDLMRMAVARARQLKALATGRLPVTSSALVVGGGLAGMTAALAIADQGFDVHLVEQDTALGGQLRSLRFTLEGVDVGAYLAELVSRVERHPRVKTELGARLLEVTGHVGNFVSRIDSHSREKTLRHGVIVLATGGSERPTEQYRYGRHRRVITQRELETRLAGGHLPPKVGDAPVVVMLQCVGSRDEQHPYCSRVCCAEAVKNALRLKEIAPRARVVVLYREMRTYGYRELYYRKARQAGVLFIRYPDDQRPRLSESGRLRVTVTDRTSLRRLVFRPDLLVLSTGIAPAQDNPRLSGLLRTALTADGFFLEAHPKLRPVDLANEGEYLCGLAHSPRFMDETIAQAKAAAGRAATVLSRTHLEIAGQLAQVDPRQCVACATCVKVCPYGAPMINALNKAEIQAAKCMGCGSCTAACPARTITLRHQEDRQMSAMLEELLTAAGGAE